MTDLIRLDEIVKKQQEEKRAKKGYTYVYRKSALEMSEEELKELIDDIDEITTCLVEETERLSNKIADMEKLNHTYVDLIKKLVELIVVSGERECETVLAQIREWVAEEKRSPKQ